jgi:hypothetical protein
VLEARFHEVNGVNAFFVVTNSRFIVFSPSPDFTKLAEATVAFGTTLKCEFVFLPVDDPSLQNTIIIIREIDEISVTDDLLE